MGVVEDKREIMHTNEFMSALTEQSPTNLRLFSFVLIYTFYMYVKILSFRILRIFS